MPETQDEDQSISDDEEFDRVTYDYGNLESLQSIYRSKKKDENSVLSQLEMLQRGGSNLPIANSCNQNFRLLQDLDDPKENKIEGSTWSGALREAEELDSLREQESNSGSQKVQKCTGVKARPTFSIRIQSYKGKHSHPSSLKNIFEDSTPNVENPWPLESFEEGIMEHSVVHLLDNFVEDIEHVSEESQKDGEIAAAVHGDREHSMAELLDDLYKKNGASGGECSMNGNTKNERRTRFAGKKVVNFLGSRNLDNEDPLLPTDSSTSSEEESLLVQPHNLLVSCLKDPEIRGQTMAERFQEFFSSTEVDTSESYFPISKYLGAGYHGRLQQVVQKEKNQHSAFLSLLQTGSSRYDESRCIVVQILSRCLEAKLTACDCLFAKNSERFQSGKRPQKSVSGEECWRGKIIFSPTICDDVELEVGNLIRLYPPWKEVQVQTNENVLLCTYFSQVVSA